MTPPTLSTKDWDECVQVMQNVGFLDAHTEESVQIKKRSLYTNLWDETSLDFT